MTAARTGVLLVLSACSALADGAAIPTFDRDVAPILDKNCLECHRAGQIGAAQSLVTYESARRWAAAIKVQVTTRAMPPWSADPAHSLKFRNDRRLDQKDVDALVAWVDAGAPRGPVENRAPIPDSMSQWSHAMGRPPDAVLELPEVSVAASGEIPYVQQRVKVPLRDDTWIVALQVRPGNNLLVHHMGITEVTLPEGMQPADLDALASVARQMGLADDALTNMRPAVTDPLNSGAYDMLGVYTPGTTLERYENDSGRLLKAGDNMYINFNIHYATTGQPERNHSELGLWLQTAKPEHQLFRAPAAVATLIANGRELLTDAAGSKAEGTDFAVPPIAPYAANYELVGVTAYRLPLTIYQLQPHAHMRGKDFKYSVVYPDGHEVTVLTVPHYDFHWQPAYELATPLQLPAGSKLLVTAHYDNSSANRYLTAAGLDRSRCGPDREAYFLRQNQSWHEMFSPLIQYSTEAGAVLPLVEAVGCLDAGASGTWQLANAGDPVPTQRQSTSASALRAARVLPLGSRSYRLLGGGVFAPQRLAHRKVAAKGVLITADGETRINVTSLQPIAGTCP